MSTAPLPGATARAGRTPRPAAPLTTAQLQQIDARKARLALLRSCLAPVAAGDFSWLRADTDCRFLADFLAAAPVRLEPQP